MVVVEELLDGEEHGESRQHPIAVIRRPLAMIQVSVVMMRRPAAPRDQQVA
jgi:hypothetical protein